MQMARIKINQNGAIKIISRSTQDGIRDHMNMVLDEAIRQAPLDTGDLKNSGKIYENPKSTRIAFEAPHAMIQHENLEYNHPKGGKAKYLEDPFHALIPGAYQRVANNIKRNLK